MYSSLDRTDIALGPNGDGCPQFVQTDHRTAEEINSSPELSAAFALVRLVNPRRLGEEGEAEPLVIYTCEEEPPEFLKQIISTAAGTLALRSGLKPISLPEPQPFTETMNQVLADLCRVTLEEFSINLDLEGIEAMEAALNPPDAEEDEIAYWSAVMKLGSVGGELIRKLNGGEWVIAHSGSLPFALTTTYNKEQATVNPLGKAIKYFGSGAEDSLLPLIEMLSSSP